MPSPVVENVAPSSAEIVAKATEITSRPDYDLRTRQADLSWFYDLLDTIFRWLLAPFRWLYEITSGLPEVLRWLLVIALLVVCALIVWHILVTIARALGGSLRAPGQYRPEGRREPDPAELESAAEEARLRGDFITGVRLLFRSLIVRLDRAEKRPYRPGTTNREFMRRYRARPAVAEALRGMVDVIDAKWYGGDVCTAGDYEACRAAYVDVRGQLGGGA